MAGRATDSVRKVEEGALKIGAVWTKRMHARERLHALTVADPVPARPPLPRARRRDPHPRRDHGRLRPARGSRGCTRWSSGKEAVRQAARGGRGENNYQRASAANESGRNGARSGEARRRLHANVRPAMSGCRAQTDRARCGRRGLYPTATAMAAVGSAHRELAAAGPSGLGARMRSPTRKSLSAGARLAGRTRGSGTRATTRRSRDRCPRRRPRAYHGAQPLAVAARINTRGWVGSLNASGLYLLCCRTSKRAQAHRGPPELGTRQMWRLSEPESFYTAPGMKTVHNRLDNPLLISDCSPLLYVSSSFGFGRRS